MLIRSVLAGLAVGVTAPLALWSQTEIALQPLAQQTRRLEQALVYLGQPLEANAAKAISAAVGLIDESAAVREIQRVLDELVLVHVEINPESRVKVRQGAANAELVEQGTRLFLVKVHNQAGVTAPLRVISPNSGPTSLRSRGEHEPALELGQQQVRERWAEISIYSDPPMAPRLTGLPVEYEILQIYSRDRGQRSAKIAMDVGQGSQDIGFRNDMLIAFDIAPSRSIPLRVRDENGESGVASFLFKDRQGRGYPTIPIRPNAWSQISHSSSMCIASMAKTSACRRDTTPSRMVAALSSTRAPRNCLSMATLQPRYRYN